MTPATLSSKGHIILPRFVRSSLHLSPGTRLICEIHGESIILTPELTQTLPAREYVTDPLTGLRVTKAREAAKPVTSASVKALMEDYP